MSYIVGREGAGVMLKRCEVQCVEGRFQLCRIWVFSSELSAPSESCGTEAADSQKQRRAQALIAHLNECRRCGRRVIYCIV